MYDPVLFRDRPRAVQIVSGGVIPAALGIAAGVLAGASAPGYWVLAGLVAVGSVIAGFEHRDGWGGADRGFFGGVIYGIALVVTHAIINNHLKVSLGSTPGFLPVVTAIVGMFLSAAGGRIARLSREKAGRAEGEAPVEVV